jgi:hypothetical protein
VKNLLALKQWVSIEDAARFLSLGLQEVVNAADVLQMALEGQLRISVSFVNGVWAQRGSLTTIDDANLPPPCADLSKVMRGETPVVLRDGSTVFVPRRDADKLKGIFDLPLAGGERDHVEALFQGLRDGPIVRDHDEAGSFICDAEQNWWRLLWRRTDLQGHDLDKLFGKSGFLVAGFPPGAEIVARPSALRQLLERLEPSPAKERNKSSETRVTETLQRMVIGMAIKGYSYDPSQARSLIPGELAKDLADLGLEVTDETIRNRLKEASKLLPGQRN